VTFWGTLVANEVKTFFLQMNLFWGQDGSLGAISPVPLPGYVTAHAVMPSLKKSEKIKASNHQLFSFTGDFIAHTAMLKKNMHNCTNEIV